MAHVDWDQAARLINWTCVERANGSLAQMVKLARAHPLRMIEILNVRGIISCAETVNLSERADYPFARRP